MSAEIISILDTGSVGAVVLGIIVLILAEALSDRFGRFHSIQLSVVLISGLTILLSSVTLDTVGVQLVVAIFVLSFLLPVSIVFLIVWSLTEDFSRGRTQYIALIGWIISLSTALALRIPLGWGEFDSVVTNIVLALIMSVITGILGGVIALYLVRRTGIYKKTDPLRS